MPDVDNIEPNSRVRVGDVTVGNVTKIERQGWHALVTMESQRRCRTARQRDRQARPDQPAGFTAHRTGAADRRAAAGQAARRFADPAVVGGQYPTTEQTLAAVSLLLNGGGLGQIQDITKAFSTAFAGREDDLRSLIEQLDVFIGYLNDQTDDIIAATESLNNLVGQFADQKPVVDKALTDDSGRAGGAEGPA